MQVVDYLLNALQIDGINHLFMVPGGYVDPFVSAFKRFPEIQPIVAAHEGGAVFMADGYARVSGKFGVALGIGGPGITNMVTGIANAFTDKVPLMVLTGEAKTYLEGRGAFQDSSPGAINAASILQSITSKKLTLINKDSLQHHWQLLLRYMLGHATRGPVHFSLPVDLQTENVNFDYQALPASLYRPKLLDHAASDATWSYLDGAKKIAILAGTGVLDGNANQQLLQFAERYHIPVATTLTAKGVFPEDHPLSLGILGWFSNPRAEILLQEEIDVLIVLGSRLHQVDTLLWDRRLLPKKALIINDMNEANLFANYRPDLFVLGDCGEYLSALHSADDKLAQPLLATITQRQVWLEQWQQKLPYYYDVANCASDELPLHPARVASELRKAMPKNTILFNGEGASNFITAHYWTTYQPRTFFMPVRYMSPMGWCIAAAIGGKFAKPDVPVVCVIGDGSMLMHGMELHTAARYGLPIIIVLMNNGAHGNPQLRARKISQYESDFLKLPFHDWAAIANAMGATGLNVTKPEELAPTFAKALGLNRTVLIDVHVGNYDTPTYGYDAAMGAFKRGEF